MWIWRWRLGALRVGRPSMTLLFVSFSWYSCGCSSLELLGLMACTCQEVEGLDLIGCCVYEGLNQAFITLIYKFHGGLVDDLLFTCGLQMTTSVRKSLKVLS